MHVATGTIYNTPGGCMHKWLGIIGWDYTLHIKILIVHKMQNYHPTPAKLSILQMNISLSHFMDPSNRDISSQSCIEWGKVDLNAGVLVPHILYTQQCNMSLYIMDATRIQFKSLRLFTITKLSSLQFGVHIHLHNSTF